MRNRQNRILLNFHIFYLQISAVKISSDAKLILTGAEDSMLHIYHFGVPDKPVCKLFLHIKPTQIHISDNGEAISVIGARENEENRLLLFKARNLLS